MFNIIIKILILTIIVAMVGSVSDLLLDLDKPYMYAVGFVVGFISAYPLNKLAADLFKIS